ncbi:hypothetical protein JW935_27175 [candidate division KSB1 bacterium]|nr:hypothetical protein [candidate division KSB1 bacterium]
MKRSNEKIKVILASRPKMLSDVIRNMVEHQQDMEVIGEVLDPIELLIAAKEIPVDVVIITPLKADGKPRICFKLLEEHPFLKILILSAEGKTAVLYQSNIPAIHIEKPSVQAIFQTIRKSIQ